MLSVFRSCGGPFGKHGCACSAHLSWVVLASSQVDQGCTVSHYIIITSSYVLSFVELGVRQLALWQTTAHASVRRTGVHRWMDLILEHTLL